VPKFEGVMPLEIYVTIEADNLSRAEELFEYITVSSPVAIAVVGNINLLCLDDNIGHGQDWSVKEIEENG
jgi:hypothetical protein